MNGVLPIDWSTVDPAALPEASPIRRALEDGRPDVAAWLSETYPDGAALYVQREGTVRRWVLRDVAFRLLASGASRRSVARRLGVARGAV